ncbi:MAG: hypothetical protein J6T60_15780 [Bacteroidales bacterium]|nr:hypothetical protein [Bacteroidales bacterium]
MKKTFLKFLPIAAAVLFATSCSKDDNGSTVVDNIATPDPVQEVVKPEAKTITITGKVNQNLSKVTTDEDLNLLFAGNEEFYIIDNEKNKCGSLTIQSDKSTYVAKIDAENIDKGPFEARLGEYPDVSDWSTVTAYPTLQEALDAAYYIIPFSVTKSGDTYSIGDVTASIQCAFVKALSSKDIEVGHVTAGNYYIVPEGEMISSSVDYAKSGKIYKVGGKDALSGEFSVGGGKTVSFSKGNLMYRPGFGYFFADKQWDYIGPNEGNTSETSGTRDLFGWGMWLEGGSPMKSTESNGDYTWSEGAKSAIGSDWSTLSDAQWSHLLGLGDGTKRDNAASLRKWRTVNEVKGLVILPDGCTADIDGDWSTLETAGAVFLPAAGYRYGAEVYRPVFYGDYWSSSADADDDGASWFVEFAADASWFEEFAADGVVRDIGARYVGRSVRLVSGL